MNQNENDLTFVIFMYFGKIAVTTKENYDTQIRNERLINTYPEGTSVTEVIESFTNWGIAKESQFVDKTGE